jgi:hypothetical protein
VSLSGVNGSLMGPGGASVTLEDGQASGLQGGNWSLLVDGGGNSKSYWYYSWIQEYFKIKILKFK